MFTSGGARIVVAEFGDAAWMHGCRRAYDARSEAHLEALIEVADSEF
jgi:hypothetical protein